MVENFNVRDFFVVFDFVGKNSLNNLLVQLFKDFFLVLRVLNKIDNQVLSRHRVSLGSSTEESDAFVPMPVAEVVIVIAASGINTQSNYI